MANVLIIEDDQAVANALTEILKHMGHAAERANTLASGLTKSTSEQYDVVLLDVRLPDGSGLDIINKIRYVEPSPEVIIMTGFGDPDGAELAIKSGAWDYIEKPLTYKRIELLLRQVVQYRTSLKKTEKPAVALRREGIIGRCPALIDCLDRVAEAAGTKANVLISGETGTGKELFAKAIHNNSQRAHKNLVVVDCTALSETLVESALFGHVKGAFTGALESKEGLIRQADGSTLFLDEIGELTLSLQKKFLRVLQERRFRPVGGGAEVSSDFRLVAATNRDLHEMVKRGLFRKDLLYRLQTMRIELPPLRECKQDIKELVLHYVAKFSEVYGMPAKGVSPDFLKILSHYDWPGNIRELVGCIEGSLASARHELVLYPKHLPDSVRIPVARKSLEKTGHMSIDSPEVPFPMPKLNKQDMPAFSEFRKETLSAATKEYLRNLMAAVNGSLKEACKVSGLGRTRLYNLLKEHNVSRYGWPSSNGDS